MDHRIKQLLTYAGKLMAVVINLNLLCFIGRYLMHDGPVGSISLHRHSFFIDGEACGLDLTALNDRLLVAFGFLLLVINGYRKGELAVK